MRTMRAMLMSTVMAVAATVAVMAHPMTYKGTVVSVGADSLQVKAVDDMTKKESTMTFKVSAKTKIMRGETVVTFADAKIQKDERIAVTINMDEAPDAALEIRLAPAAGAAPSPAAAMPPMDHMGATDKSTTVTGCVATATEAGHYMLNNGMLAGQKTGKTYDLVGEDMKAHVGHKVAVTGTVEAASMKGKTMTPKGMSAMHSTLHITSVKMIAASCS